MASFACINEGDPDATWHSECLFDSDCPMDGICINDVLFLDPATGEPLYPDGVCIKERCELTGRGCGTFEDTGGECVNIATPDDPRYTCFASCVTGYGPEDGDLNPCRHRTGAHPYTCKPHPPETFFPPGGQDGLCVPAMIPTGTPMSMYSSACFVDEDCASPKGLGTCFEVVWRSFCSAHCDRTLAESQAICGAAPSPGAVVPGVCNLGLCLPSCDTPRGTLGANGCPETFMACYPDDGSYGHVGYFDSAGSSPAGFCIQACTTSTDCETLWGMSTSCDTVSGVCG
jgi:hypothetical protein